MSQNLSQIDKSKLNWGVHWFRRDLRVAGNEALRTNWKKTAGNTLGFFSFDSTFLSRSDFSANRFAFFLKTLDALKNELQSQGGDLLIVDSPPLQAFTQLLKYCDKAGIKRPSTISYNRDYEPFAISRDQSVTNFLQSQEIDVSTHRDHLLFEPYEVLKSEKANDFYQIYSPYGRKWFSRLAAEVGQERIAQQKNANSYYKKLESNELDASFKLNWKSFLKDSQFPFQDALQSFQKENDKNVSIVIPEAGSLQAYRHMQKFKKNIVDYLTARDFPAQHGTSRLSIYLKNGSLVSTQIISELKLNETAWEPKDGYSQFLKEIAWREFYYSILYHRPDVEKTSFNPQYKNLKWENNLAYFKRWQEGTTGFPIVDAGMRELLTTGWMHNRVRMIVASFLTKDLLIDWKWGENHFMKYLLDGDLAPNNGGWQWAASTGCDPQPYFRIFNPWLQSEKFDPDGTYIKQFIPELKSVPAKALHDPDGERYAKGYPKPIVDHKSQKDKALAIYKANRKA